MPQTKRPASEIPETNFFRPRQGYMRRKVRYIWVMLSLWALSTVGFQLLLAFSSQSPAGEGPLTTLVVLGFPFHYWFTGQFLILFFIILCFVFNILIDRLSGAPTRHRFMEGPHV